MADHIVAIDQGTTGSTALVLAQDGRVLARGYREFAQHYPRPGWVEHDADEIWQSVVQATEEALAKAAIAPGSVACLGITNQRETAVAWDRETGEPLHRALVWQDRRTSDYCESLRRAGHEPALVARTGLLVDPYFSATKYRWLVTEVVAVRAAAEAARLCLGTVDSFLLWRITGGRHATDVTNASRSQLMDLRSLAWDESLCELFGVPGHALPAIQASGSHFGVTRGFATLPDGVPITAMAGDQHAALFGQGCFAAGSMKCTYGTGAFLLANTGAEPVFSDERLLTTVAWQLGNEVCYALEGSVFMAGAAVQWLRDGLALIDSAGQIEALARQVADSGGVVFVPALAGLGAPYWSADARGLLCGITRGTTRAHIARATLEAIALQVDDLIRTMARTMGRAPRELRVDGGAVANDLLMEMQAGLSELVVVRPVELESTARGIAMLAGISVGLLDRETLAREMIRTDREFGVSMTDAERQAARSRWELAVRRTLLGPSEAERVP